MKSFILPMLVLVIPPAVSALGVANYAGYSSFSISAAAQDEAPAPATILGLDLNTVPLVDEPAKLTDLFDPPLPSRSGRPGRLKSETVFSMPLKQPQAANQEESYWLRFPLAAGRFYIQYRSNSTAAATIRYYGPIEGDPFERMTIEQSLTERLTTEDYSPDDIFRVQEMFKTDNAALVRRAARLTQAVLDAKQEVYRKRAYIVELRQISDRYAATLKKHGLEGEWAAIELGIGELEHQIEQLTVELPIEEYVTAATLSDKLPPAGTLQSAVESKSGLGETTNGLRLIAVPAADVATIDQPLRIKLIVENVGPQPIKFAAMSALNDARAEAQDASRVKLQTRKGNFSGRGRLERFLLLPSERVVVAEPSILVTRQINGPLQPGISRIEIRDTREQPTSPLKVRYTLNLGSGGERWQRSQDGIMRRTSPARGEWTGSLTTGDMVIEVDQE